MAACLPDKESHGASAPLAKHEHGPACNGKAQGSTPETKAGSLTYGDVDLSAIPVLPETIQLCYVAEGAANIIYRFSLPENSADVVDGALPPGVDKTHLVRLRKALPSGSPNLLAFAALQKIFFPLFPKELVLDTRIIGIPLGLVERQNAILKDWETSGKRSAKRVGLYLVGPPPPPGTPLDDNGEKSTLYERYGLLVEDMTPASPVIDAYGRISCRQVLVEFKPKWLVPSPSAPPNSRRCRTCALRISKEFKKFGTKLVGNGSGLPGHWCPYDLGSGEPHRVRLAVQGILSQKGAILTGWKNAKGGKGDVDEGDRIILEDKVVGYFTGTKGKKLLGLLKQFQTEWDPRGPAAVFGESGDTPINADRKCEDGEDGEWGDEWNEEVRKLLMAMTIRDLTLFLRVDLSASSPSASETHDSVQARIGDLDLKTPENGKAKYWIDFERKLGDGGWYTGTESAQQMNGHRPGLHKRDNSVGDKRKFGKVEGSVVEGRKLNAEGIPVDVIVERERDEEGLDGRNGGAGSSKEVRWCIF